jgi:pyrroloquinoline quinone biosynthesis protein B
MFIVVLGSAAGGGFPQWNCNAPTSRGIREGRIRAKPRTQASIAVSRDGENWLLINASPDFRQQQAAARQLWPREQPRHSPIKAVLLTSAEIDHVAGLLSMRESQSFTLWATGRVHDILAENPIFGALAPDYVTRRSFDLGKPWDISGNTGSLGLTIEAFSVPGKVPLFLEARNRDNLAGGAEDTIGLRVSDGRSSFFFIPGCARLTDDLRQRLKEAALLFFDGTLWTDDELQRQGIGAKTGQRMGHMSIDGAEGTIAAFHDLNVQRKLFIHINTTNPVLDEDSAAHAAMRRAGWEIAEDGMEIRL